MSTNELRSSARFDLSVDALPGPTVYSVDDLILLSQSPLVQLKRKEFAHLRSITTTSAGGTHEELSDA